jgi:leader peptidase (prepilin peptidase)/N-methyltransferase
MNLIFIVFNTIIGASMGSFLNVVARRTEEDLPWWGKERSRCPNCQHSLEFYDLVPVLSFLFLKGRCRYCGKKISPAYLAVELVGALAGGILAWRWGIGPAALMAVVTAYGLLLNSLTDIYSGYIYDLFALSIGITGILIRSFAGVEPVLDGIYGAAAGFAVIAVIIVASRGRMGWGDASLMAGLGSSLGLKMVSVALYLGFMTGGFIALSLLLLKKVKRKDAIPLGPFLAAGGLLAMLFGPAILAYIGMQPDWPWH